MPKPKNPTKPKKRKKRKLKPVTPKSVIRKTIMKMWMWSRERRECLKIHGKDCVDCGEPFKEVHHIKPIDWDRIFTVIYEEVLNTETRPLCEECHEPTKKESNFKKKGSD